MTITIKREGLKLSLIGGVFPARGSSDVPIQLQSDGSYSGYMITPQFGWYQNGAWKEAAGTYDDGIKLPAQMYRTSGYCYLALALAQTENAGHVEVTNQIQIPVPLAPHGSSALPDEQTMQEIIDNAAQLAAQQLKKKGLSADKLYQHHDWSGKNCPSQIRAGKPYNWSTFKSKVKAYYNGSTSASKPGAGTGSGSSSSKKTVSQLADEVIAGKWGNGDTRKKKLEAAGYDYDAVQKEVNKQLGVSTSTGSTSKPSPKKKTVTLPSSASSWRVYPTNKAPVIGNECGYLYPSKFGGLTYDIIATPQADVVTIQTRDYGKVNIYVAKSTGAIIK